jgi:hypothetical protein
MKRSGEHQRRGALVDWTMQRWVQATGRRVALEECSWLIGPVGDVDVIGADFFARFAEREGLTMVTNGPPRGLVEDFTALAGPACDPSRVDARVAKFYEQTSECCTIKYGEELPDPAQPGSSLPHAAFRYPRDVVRPRRWS